MYAVIFSLKRSNTLEGYQEMDELTMQEAEKINGYKGYESVYNENQEGIFISYWESMEAINEWRNNTLHQTAKLKGIEQWYDRYSIKICKIEHSNDFVKNIK